MEYQDYVDMYTKFATEPEQKLYNPLSPNYHYRFKYNKTTKSITTDWYTMTDETFVVTRKNYYDGLMTDHVDNILPEKLNLTFVGKTMTINGYPLHPRLIFNHKTGEVLHFEKPRFPVGDDETALAVSTLRKHVTAYKRKARPIYRLLEGSLTENKDKSEYAWYAHQNERLTPHQTYEILRKRSPTPDQIKLLMKDGNKSWSYSVNTNFEASISRVIQRQRKELQCFALLEANNEYTPPKNI